MYMGFPEEEIQERELCKSNSNSLLRYSLEEVFSSAAFAEFRRCRPNPVVEAFDKADLVFRAQLFQPES
jgi:hypothetical protein